MKKNISVIFSILLLSACKDNHKVNQDFGLGMDETAADTATVQKSVVKMDSIKRKEFHDSAYLKINDTVLANGSKPTSWEAAGIRDEKGLKLFIRDLQAKVAADLKNDIAQMVRFPIPRVKNIKQFNKSYTKLFTPAVKEAVAKTNINQLFRNSKGVMIGDGKIWIIQEGDKFKITAINN